MFALATLAKESREPWFEKPCRISSNIVILYKLFYLSPQLNCALIYYGEIKIPQLSCALIYYGEIKIPFRIRVSSINKQRNEIISRNRFQRLNVFLDPNLKHECARNHNLNTKQSYFRICRNLPSFIEVWRGMILFRDVKHG